MIPVGLAPLKNILLLSYQGYREDETSQYDSTSGVPFEDGRSALRLEQRPIDVVLGFQH